MSNEEAMNYLEQIKKEIQKSPERKVFYVDVGDLPTDKAIEYLERIKKEME